MVWIGHPTRNGGSIKNTPAVSVSCKLVGTSQPHIFVTKKVFYFFKSFFYENQIDEILKHINQQYFFRYVEVGDDLSLGKNNMFKFKLTVI